MTDFFVDVLLSALPLKVQAAILSALVLGIAAVVLWVVYG